MSRAKTNAERIAKWRARQAQAGLVTCTVLVTRRAAEDIKVAADIIKAHPHLSIGSLVDSVSGKFVSMRTPV